MANVDRRTLLVGAVATFATSSQLFRTPAAATLSPLLVRHEPRLLYRYAADFSSAIPWDMPGLIRISAASSALVKETLAISWDARLADATGEAVFLRVRDQVTQIRGRVSTEGNRSTLFVPTGGAAAENPTADEWLFLPQVRPAEDFYRVGLNTIEETSIRVLGHGKTAKGWRPSVLAGHVAVNGKLWAGELSVIWGGSTRGGSATDFTYPQTVLLSSQGPGPVPAGARIRVTADEATVGRISCRAATDESGALYPVEQQSEKLAGSTQLILVLRKSLPKTTIIRFDLAITDKSERSPDSRARSACTVSLDSGSNPPELHRPTGTESRALIS